MLSVTFNYYYPKCHYAECRYAECRGAAYFAFCNQQNDRKEKKIWFDFFFFFEILLFKCHFIRKDEAWYSQNLLRS
jgi:hypothetical protein